MDTEKIVSLVTIIIALGSTLGTIISGQRAVKKDAFEDLRAVVDLVKAQLTSAQDEIAKLKVELAQSETRVNELETENIALKKQNAVLEMEVQKLRERFDDTMVRKRNGGSKA